MNILNIAREKGLAGTGLTFDEGLEITKLPESKLFTLLSVTEEVRSHWKGTEISFCSIVNAKSGHCKEDCSFCSQSVHFDTGIETFPMTPAEGIVEAAKEAQASGAREFSIVTSGTKVQKEGDVAILKEALEEMERGATDMERCASLGNIKAETLATLKASGLQSYHHNLETSRSHFPKICTTHEYEDDVATVRLAKEAGLHTCSGGIFGIGESWRDRVELAETLQELDVDSIPINLLNPRPGTPLSEGTGLTPKECLMIIALYRLMLPQKDIFICGGREVNLRDLQSMIFAAGANGMMLGNYLTTKGRDAEEDLKMIEDLGLTVKATH